MRSTLLLLTIVLAGACAGPRREALPPGAGITPDSLRAAFRTYYGPTPGRLGQCGSRRLFIAFRNAPGDVREQARNVPGGREVFSNALVDQGRGGLAFELASIAVAALPTTAAIDTISVELDKSAGSAVQYHFVLDRNARSHGIAVQPIVTGLNWCAPVG